MGADSVLLINRNLARRAVFSGKETLGKKTLHLLDASLVGSLLFHHLEEDSEVKRDDRDDG